MFPGYISSSFSQGGASLLTRQSKPLSCAHGASSPWKETDYESLGIDHVFIRNIPVTALQHLGYPALTQFGSMSEQSSKRKIGELQRAWRK